MNHSDVEPVTIMVDDARSVSALLLAPPQARACYVMAHGAGAGMAHPFMERVAAELGERGIATLRYQFPYMEHGSKRPDPPKVAHAAVRAAVAARPESAFITADIGYGCSAHYPRYVAVRGVTLTSVRSRRRKPRRPSRPRSNRRSPGGTRSRARVRP
jgi:hypothetical protein